jgi:hypothetical protein
LFAPPQAFRVTAKANKETGAAQRRIDFNETMFFLFCILGYLQA